MAYHLQYVYRPQPVFRPECTLLRVWAGPRGFYSIHPHRRQGGEGQWPEKPSGLRLRRTWFLYLRDDLLANCQGRRGRRAGRIQHVQGILLPREQEVIHQRSIRG